MRKFESCSLNLWADHSVNRKIWWDNRCVFSKDILSDIFSHDISPSHSISLLQTRCKEIVRSPGKYFLSLSCLLSEWPAWRETLRPIATARFRTVPPYSIGCMISYMGITS